MSISRVKPRSEKTVNQALSKAKTRAAAPPPAQQALTPDTIIALNAKYTSFRALLQLAIIAKYLMMKSTTLVEKAKTLARNFVNAYFQVYNIGITLTGVYDKESRVFYGLDEKDGRVPYLGSEAEITYWGDQIHTGDANRVTAGGAPMANPTAADVDTYVDDFNTKNNEQAILKLNYQDAQAAVTADMPDAIKVVTKVWDEVETKYDGDSIEAMRQKAREWGVVYESTEKTIVKIIVKAKVSGVLLAGAVTALLESGVEQTSNAAGEETFETTIAFGVTFETSLDGYVTNNTPLEFTDGLPSYDLVIEMEAV